MADPQASFIVETEAAEMFLRDRYGTAVGANVAPCGAGSWSRCFSFELAGEPRIIKLSPHRADLDCDRVASSFARPGLPVPQVVDYGEALGMHFTVADLAPGHPLESSSADEWNKVVPSVADALDTMRVEFAEHRTGWGGWAETGAGQYSTWRAFLLDSVLDKPGGRVAGWGAKLDTDAFVRRTFDRACGLIAELASDDVPRGLLHCDLLYRNAHVHGQRLAGVFDWGCSIYGDPLMELGWFEFWNPWYPQLDVARLHAELIRRSDEFDVRRHRDRWLTVLMWIGATHISYQAFIDSWDDVHATTNRMHDLAVQLGADLR